MIKKLVSPGQCLRVVDKHKQSFKKCNPFGTLTFTLVPRHGSPLLKHKVTLCCYHMQRDTHTYLETVTCTWKNMSTHTRTHAHKRVRGEVRRSLPLRAGAMSCQMGLAPRQLMSQSSLWSPSRAPWFTCLGCQVLPSPSLMQHGCPLNLFVSGSCGRLALAMTEHWATKRRRRTHAGALAKHMHAYAHIQLIHTHTQEGLQVQMQVH